MSASETGHTANSPTTGSVDWLLRFTPSVQARYDSETGPKRVAELRSAILFGLALYNVYNITSIVLLQDLLGISIVLRLGLVTSVSLALAWLIGRTTPQTTERLVLFGILNAYFVPVFLFWTTRDPWGLFTFGELFLSIVFGNMVLALRFRHAAIFTICALGVTLLAVGTKGGIDPSLQFAFGVQVATACAFGLYGNYRFERRRCSDYLTALGATIHASDADAARNRFHALSRTDALTGLPNRRHLEERMEELLALPTDTALMMIDIDQFKLYNDSLGHPAGDDCLRRVAAVFAEAGAQKGAFCARFGGEEFTFLLHGLSELETVRRAKKLLHAVEALGIPHGARSDGPGVVTISIGIARREAGSEVSPEELLAAADRALYLAKQRGRNRFVMDDGSTGGVARTI